MATQVWPPSKDEIKNMPVYLKGDAQRIEKKKQIIDVGDGVTITKENIVAEKPQETAKEPDAEEKPKAKKGRPAGHSKATVVK